MPTNHRKGNDPEIHSGQSWDDQRMADRPVTLTTGIPETVLDAEPAAAQAALASALALTDPAERHQAVSNVVAAYPRYLDAWAQLGALGRNDVEAYAAFRVGYHRGLDRLRASGWRGSGYVRWRHENNRGFLRALAGLHNAAKAIAEDDETDRIAMFIGQLDPEWARSGADWNAA
jgi:hypothetical protein